MEKIVKGKSFVLFLFGLMLSLFALSCGSNVEAVKDASLSLDLSPLISSRVTENTFYKSPFEGTFYIEISAKSFASTTSTYYYEYTPEVEAVDLALNSDNTFTRTIPDVPLNEKIHLSLNIYSSSDLSTSSLAAYGETDFSIDKSANIQLAMTICKYTVVPGTVTFEPSSYKDFIADGFDYAIGDTISYSVDSITTSPAFNDVTYAWSVNIEETGETIEVSNDADNTGNKAFSFIPKTAGTYKFNVTAKAVIDGNIYTVTDHFATKKVEEHVVTKIELSNAPTTYLLPTTGTYANTWQKITVLATEKPTYADVDPSLSIPGATLTYSDKDESGSPLKVTVANVETNYITCANDTAYAKPTAPGDTTYTVTYGKATATYTVTSYGIVLPTCTWTSSGSPADEKGEFNAGDTLTYTTELTSTTNLPAKTNDGLFYEWQSSIETDVLKYTDINIIPVLLDQATCGTHTLSLTIGNIYIVDTEYQLSINNITSVTVHGGTITVTPKSGSNETLALTINNGNEDVTSINCLDTTTGYTFTATCATATASTVYTWYANGTDLNILTQGSTITQSVPNNHTTSSVTCTANTFVNAFSAIQIGKNTLTVTVTEEGVIVGRATLTFTVTAEQ